MRGTQDKRTHKLSSDQPSGGGGGGHQHHVLSLSIYGCMSVNTATTTATTTTLLLLLHTHRFILDSDIKIPEKPGVVVILGCFRCSADLEFSNDQNNMNRPFKPRKRTMLTVFDVAYVNGKQKHR